MKKTVIFSIIFLFLAGFYFFYRQEKQDTSEIHNTQSSPKTLAKETEHPFSIAALSKKEYSSDGFLSKEPVGEYENYRSYVASYLSDGLTQFALLHVPRSTDNRLPVVVVNHGYIDPDVYSTVSSYQNTSAFYARQGFVVAKPDYRGHDLSEGDPREPLARVKYAIDVMNLVSALSKENYVDNEKIFLYGHSMGGDVALRLLEISDQFAAASLWAPAVTNFPESQFYFIRKNRRAELAERKAELDRVVNPDQYEEISSFAHLDQVQAPVLIHHGTADESVPYDWGQTLARKLQEAGKNVTFRTYPGDNHDLTANFARILMRDIDFFKSQ